MTFIHEDCSILDERQVLDHLRCDMSACELAIEVAFSEKAVNHFAMRTSP